MYKPYFESDDLSDSCWDGYIAYGLKTKDGKKVPNCVKEDYRMEHTAPDKESGDPLHDLSNVYPEDLYSSNGAKYYGDGNSYDGLTVSIIRQYKGKPNAMVTIYRAIPDFNKETKKKIKALTDILKYKAKFGFAPQKNQIIWDLQDKYPIEKYSYDEQQKLIYQDIEKQLEELKKNLSKKVEINPGDWVGITKQYAIDHGKSHVDDYMIISKKVKAKDVYTNGDSIHEWGYSP